MKIKPIAMHASVFPTIEQFSKEMKVIQQKFLNIAPTHNTDMNTNTIHEIQEKKKDLATSIYQKIAKFEEDTGIEVSSIWIERADIQTCSDQNKNTVITKIDVEIKL